MPAQLDQGVGEAGAAVQPLLGGGESRPHRWGRQSGELADRLGRCQSGVQAHHHQLDGVRHRRVDRLAGRACCVAPTNDHYSCGANAPDDCEPRFEDGDDGGCNDGDGQREPATVARAFVRAVVHGRRDAATCGRIRGRGRDAATKTAAAPAEPANTPAVLIVDAR